jgi:hypothetical protein
MRRNRVPRKSKDRFVRLVSASWILGFALCLGCGHHGRPLAGDAESLIRFEPDKVVAYVTGVDVQVYMITQETVIRMVIPLAERRQDGRRKVHIGRGKAQATLYRGDDIWRKVSPAGAGPEPRWRPSPDPSKPPIGPLYDEEKAITGQIVCADIPAAMTFPYHGDAAIAIVRGDLRFPSGRLRLEREMRLVLMPLPP